MSADRPEDSFAALFEETSKALPQKRGFRIGEAFDAVVVQVGKDAVFVELPGHRQGFIESNDLRAPDGTLKAAVGDLVRVRVAHVDAEQGVRFAPTVEAVLAAGASVGVGDASEPVAVKVAIGQVVSGAVERVESYGVFVQIDGTKGRAGRGLLPTAELGLPRGADLRKAFPLGTKMRAKVIEMREGKMRMSLLALKDDEERAQFDGFRDENKSATAQGFGTLGDLLKTSKPT
ncbi:MAG: S1 RNA-binding domain-containing protein [Myxococcota bacterium]|nr:S1 RNA-binding domain-containing protein [Myxococcota bacterium]